MCVVNRCDKHSTVCAKHIEGNKNENRNYKRGIRNFEKGGESLTTTMIIDTTVFSSEREKVYEEMLQMYKTVLISS